MLVLVALASCVTVEYPDRGLRITPRAGHALVFGRVQFFDEAGREYFPWSLNPLAPQLHLWLLRLDPRRVSPELNFASDGTFGAWIEAGDYALVGSRRPVGGSMQEMQDKFVVALLRVPADAVAVYAGDLVLTAHVSAFVIAELEPDYAIVGSHVSADDLRSAQERLERQFGVLPEAPAVSTWCAGKEVPGFDDPDLITHGRSLLEAGCPPSR